jgi:hypothetical protein
MVFLPNLGVNRRVCLCDVASYVSAQTLDFLDLGQKSAFLDWKHHFLSGLFRESKNPVDVLYCFPVGHIARIFSYSSGSGIIRCQGQFDITAKTVEHFAQVAGAAVDILVDIKWLCYAELFGRSRHQLHQSLSSGAGDGVCLKI